MPPQNPLRPPDPERQGGIVAAGHLQVDRLHRGAGVAHGLPAQHPPVRRPPAVPGRDRGFRVCIDPLWYHPLIPDGRGLALIYGYLRHVIFDDGLYRDVRRGLARGCPLSPLLGALYLQALDERLERLGLFYVRFMDDWIVLAPTRWKLRRAIKMVNQTLDELKLTKHPDKTTIGRVARGFDFLGYHFSPGGLSLAPQTIERFNARLARLYEQGADDTYLGHYGGRCRLLCLAF